jgi:hypothetical protein
MTVGNHVDLRARDLVAVREKMGASYDFKCVDSKLALGRETYTMWKASLVGEMFGSIVYVHVWDGVVKSTSLLS